MCAPYGAGPPVIRTAGVCGSYVRRRFFPHDGQLPYPFFNVLSGPAHGQPGGQVNYIIPFIC